MISGAYNSAPVLNRPEYLPYTASSRLFNHSYALKSTPINSSRFNYSYPDNYSRLNYSYPDNYSRLNYSYPNNYSRPQPQTQPPTRQTFPPPNYLRVNSYPVYNLPVQMSCRPSVSSKGLEAVLIAILILAALDLVIIRPLK